MKYIISVLILIQIGTLVFQIRADRKQNAAIEAIQSTDTLQNNKFIGVDTTLAIHLNNFRGIQHFGIWCVPILDAVRHDTIPTWNEYASKHMVPKDNNK
jgi:hypothetical protein